MATARTGRLSEGIAPDRRRARSMIVLALAAGAAVITVPFPDKGQSNTTSRRMAPPLLATAFAIPAPPRPSPSIPLTWPRASVFWNWQAQTSASLTERPTAPELSRDMVAHTQRDLIRLGFDPGKPDGIIGPKTRRAIRLFQKTMGMKADGVLTAELQATLRVAR